VCCPEKKLETELGNEEDVGVVVFGDEGTEEEVGEVGEEGEVGEVGDGELESSSS